MYDFFDKRKLLGKYNEIWEKETNFDKKEFDINPAYNENI